MKTCMCAAVMFLIAATCRGNLVPERPGDRGHSFRVQVMLRKMSLPHVHPPVVKRQELPRYPDSLRLAGVAGEALVRFYVDKDGTVTKRELVAASHTQFADAASIAIKQWQFGAALDTSDRPVAVVVDLVFRFELIDDGEKKA